MTDGISLSYFSHCCHVINYLEKWPAGQRGIPEIFSRKILNLEKIDFCHSEARAKNPEIQFLFLDPSRAQDDKSIELVFRHPSRKSIAVAWALFSMPSKIAASKIFPAGISFLATSQGTRWIGAG
jgi:hypothetical protein